jgi:ligand-binding sensor domain-containing protein/signal transduction histidine kinase/DNA-binding response OmpR family regulator
MRKVITYLFLFFIVFSISAKGIDSPYLFKKLNNEDGLTYNTVHDIAQDSSGIIWLTTKQGLNKYDSYHIKNYYKDDDVGMSSNFLTCLLVNHNNCLFVGSDEGLVEYNRTYDNFSPVTYNGNNLPTIWTLTESNSGQLLIGTNQGVFVYHPELNIVTKFVSLQKEQIFSIVESEEGVFWMATFSGIFILNSDGVLLEYFDTQNSNTLPTNKISRIYKDSKGTFWVGTENGGLLFYNKKEKVFTKVGLSDNEQAETRVVRDIDEDLEGNLWIATESGVFIVDGKDHKTINIRHSLEKSEYYLSDNAVYCLFRSKENIMWIGTYFGGVDYTNLSSQKGFYNIYPGEGKNELRGKAVNKIYKSSDGKLWIATEDGGVCIFNTKTKNIIKYFQHVEGNSLSSNNIHAICEDKYGNILFGHFMTGIDIYNPGTGKFRNIPLEPDIKYSITENSVYCIYKDSHDQIWVGSRMGIYLYDDEKGKLLPFKKDELSQFFIYNIIEDSSGKMWFSIRFGGIVCYNPQTDVFKRYTQDEGLSTNKIIASTEDSSGKIWFGTVDGGVNIYHPETDSFEVIKKRDGLPNNTVYGILESDNGNIWLSTNRGLSLFNYPNRTFRNNSLNDGLAQMQFNFGSYFKDEDGTLYFGHIYGLTYFNPSMISNNINKPEILFTDFKLSNQSVEITENGLLSNPINDTKRIDLSYLQKAFTIDFVAVNYFSAGNNKFYYYLEGFEDDWKDMGNTTSATYTNLLPGKYTFWLKAENNDGIESANIKSIVIHIRPPFYFSIWAFFLYAVLLVGIFLFYRKIALDKEKEKTALTYERVEKEKIKELNQLRLNFYTYISHEFKTPLSIIISSVDQLFSKKNLTEDLNLPFQRLSRSSKRLSFLFNQLMDFRKIETKHAKLVLQKGDIISFVEETCLIFSPLFEQYRVNFEFKANRENYDYWFDPDKMEKIIANLISNALKNTPVHGKVLCQTKIIEEGTNEGHLHISISDNGKGISEESLEDLFTPFYVNYNSNEQKSGSGIGLTLVKSLVDYLQGTIEVKSKINEGTKFTILLPLHYKGISNIKLENSNETISRNLDVDSITDVPLRQFELENEKASGKEFKLLIVEDSVDLSEVLIEHYSENYSVSYAPNGIRAFEIVKEEEPDIIISDVMMPEMDGIEFCKKIKSDEASSHIAVILLSAKTTHEDKIAGLEAGAEAYVSKPFDLNELDLHVRNFIEIRKKLRERLFTGTNLNLDKFNFQDKDKAFIEGVSKIITENIESEKLNTREIGQKLGLSETLVYLKLKKLLNMSGTDFIQSFRFKKAIELMADPNRNISEIAYEVGFSDPNYFSKVFKKLYKKTPSVYRNDLIENNKRLKNS